MTEPPVSLSQQTHPAPRRRVIDATLFLMVTAAGLFLVGLIGLLLATTVFNALLCVGLLNVATFALVGAAIWSHRHD